MNYRFPRRALLALLAACALPAAAPAVASASIAPSLVLTPTAVNAGQIQNLDFNLGFTPSPGDSPKDVAVTLPAGLIPNANILGGACLVSATPVTGCQVGTGTLAPASTPVSLWLVKAPNAADVAGAALVQGTTAAGVVVSTADVTFSGGQVALGFTNLPNLALSSLDLTLTNLRAPTSCPTPAATVSVAADSQMVSAVQTTSAPLTVQGCSALPFSPQLSVTAIKDTSDNNVALTTATSQTSPALQAADRTLALTVPPTALSPNVANALTALTSGATVGSATAVSPLIPVPLSGTVTLTGTAVATNLTVTFPAPFPLVLQGVVSLTNDSVTFSDVPDLPLSSLSVTLNGGSSGLYTTSCTPAGGTLMGSFGGWNGATFTSSPMFAVSGCPAAKPGKPTASAALGGLVKNRAHLKFTVSAGKNAKPIKTIAISLPTGLVLAKNAKNLKKGIHVSGATFKVSHGVLTVTLTKAATKVTVTLSRPAVSVGSKLATTVKTELKKHKAKPLRFKVKVTDSGRTTTTVTVKVAPKS